MYDHGVGDRDELDNQDGVPAKLSDNSQLAGISDFMCNVESGVSECLQITTTSPTIRSVS